MIILGRIYRICFYNNFPNDYLECLVIPTGIKNPECYDLTLLASTKSIVITYIHTFHYVWEDAVEVPKEDLPLYVGWEFITPAFTEHLAGVHHDLRILKT
jgi:hypothetical protein